MPILNIKLRNQSTVRWLQSSILIVKVAISVTSNKSSPHQTKFTTSNKIHHIKQNSPHQTKFTTSNAISLHKVSILSSNTNPWYQIKTHHIKKILYINTNSLPQYQYKFTNSSVPIYYLNINTNATLPHQARLGGSWGAGGYYIFASAWCHTIDSLFYLR